jgi:hypothetical protein
MPATNGGFEATYTPMISKDGVQIVGEVDGAVQAGR